MSQGVFGWFGVGLAVLLTAAPLSGHHAIGAKFDPDQPVTLSGSVTKVDWLNPHVHVFMDVTAAGGAVTNWAIELESTVDLERNGWNRDSVGPGEAITVDGLVARDGSFQAWGRSVVLTATGRRVLDVSSAESVAVGEDPRPAPRWPDGHPRLGPPPGESGYWGNPSATTLMETGVGVGADADGLLANIADAGEVAPFQPWAKALYEQRQRDFLKDDPMFLQCIPPGVPRQFLVPHGVQFVEEPARERIFVLEGGSNRNYRMIYMDGREQVGQIRGDDDNPIYYGRSVAEWEGDALVVDTIGFNERFWFANGGVPHTDRLHLTERILRPDFNTLSYEVTIDDPGAYTRTWSSSWTLRWIEGEEMPVYYCQDNRP